MRLSGKPTVRVLKLTEPIIQGEDVRQVQKALIKAGFDVGSDGIFGKETDQAVREFQQQKGLTVDGIVGDETRRYWAFKASEFNAISVMIPH